MTRRQAQQRRREIELLRLGKKDPAAHKPAGWEKLLTALITLANLGLAVYLHVQKRREIIHAVSDSEDVLVLVRENARAVTRSVPVAKSPEGSKKQG